MKLIKLNSSESVHKLLARSSRRYLRLTYGWSLKFEIRHLNQYSMFSVSCDLTRRQTQWSIGCIANYGCIVTGTEKHLSTDTVFDRKIWLSNYINKSSISSSSQRTIWSSIFATSNILSNERCSRLISHVLTASSNSSRASSRSSHNTLACLDQLPVLVIEQSRTASCLTIRQRAKFLTRCARHRSYPIKISI